MKLDRHTLYAEHLRYGEAEPRVIHMGGAIRAAVICFVPVVGMWWAAYTMLPA
jgi:hypothetical protein